LHKQPQRELERRMNTIFIGRYITGGLIYDYSGIWIRQSGRIDWKAIVRKEDVVCRPSGTIDDGINDPDAEQLISRLVEESIEATLEQRKRRRP
jgi:hypothetical protein